MWSGHAKLILIFMYVYVKQDKVEMTNYWTSFIDLPESTASTAYLSSMTSLAS